MSQMLGEVQRLDFSRVGFVLLGDTQEGMSQAVGHQNLRCGGKTLAGDGKLGVTGNWRALKDT